uniref:Myb/SANT-like DNA-binding domain-containing protein n=1 Tax=Neogobius melanostomus TaxID=47308 RepID=A0A8C6TAS2_9GOBI
MWMISVTEDDTRRLIELRAANEALFTGKRNTVKPAWRGIVKEAILRELGLQGKISTVQLAKKWDNLKRRYKDLRFPPVGMESSVDPSSWPWFSLMHDAMEGRLSHSAPLLDPVTCDNEPDDPPHKPPRPTRHQTPPASLQTPPAPLQAPPPPPPPPPQIHIPPNPAGAAAVTPTPDFTTERERVVLERDRQMVEQERAAVQRDRAAAQAERMWLERERADLQRDRALVEQERAALARDREILDQRAIMLNTVGHVQHSSTNMEKATMSVKRVEEPLGW